MSQVLPTFERIMAAAGDDEKPKLRRQFAHDVASHMDKMASACIQPTEGTLDFAWMYIPGTHLRNACTKYDDGQKRWDRLGLQLTQTQEESTLDEAKTS
jgi:DNA anti-recombination protein RmuC